MIVAFDGICFGDGPMTGVGRSFVNTLHAYAARDDATCVLLLPCDAHVDVPGSVRVVEAPRGALRRQRQLPRLLRSLQADVLHSSVAAVPLRATCPTIATAHDLPWLHPELPETSSAWRQFATRRSLRSASRIVCPSTMTSRDVAELLGPSHPRIETVLHGTQPGSEPTAPATDARGGPLLVLGDDRPRKNRQRLEAAHELARQEQPDLPALQFCGPPEHYVDEPTKHDLLRSCRALVHVSHFEGFGMPVLEGLAHGAPVVCSDLPPHREIATDGHGRDLALFVDPFSIEEIAAGLLRVHRDQGLRRSLATTGFERARTLTPEATAQEWSRIHREVLS